MSTIVLVALLLFALSQWNQGKKVCSLLFLVFCICNAFRLIPIDFINSAILNKWFDWALLYTIGTITLELAYGNKLFDTNDDIIGKIILFISIYCLISFLLTILLTAETMSYALQAYRHKLLFLSYFIIKTLNKDELYDLIRKISILVIVATLIFVLQPLGINLYQGGADTVSYSDQMIRYRNSPLYIQLFILVAVVTEFRYFKYPKISFLILLAGLILPMSRTPIIVLAILCVIYILQQKRVKNTFMFSLLVGGAMVFLYPIIKYRFGSTDTMNDIQFVLNMKSSADFSSSEMGTFSFRIAMLMERIEYLWDTNNFLFGVGFPHEMSDYTRSHFCFQIGTWNPVYEMYSFLETPDNTWVALFMRLGFLGTLLFVFLFYKMGHLFYDSYTINSFAAIGLLWITYLVFISNSGDTIGLSAYHNHIMLFILIRLIQSEKYQDINLISK